MLIRAFALTLLKIGERDRGREEAEYNQWQHDYGIVSDAPSTGRIHSIQIPTKATKKTQPKFT